jgi:hypothetical protein
VRSQRDERTPRSADRRRSLTVRDLLAAASLLFLAAASSPAQEEQYFAPETQPVRLLFRWDFFGRYDRIENLVFRTNIYRARFEARPELDLVVSDRFRIGARAVGDLGTDQNTDNTRNFDNYRTTGAALERYFVEGKPGPFDLKVGSFGMPLVATEMLWDHDIQTLGAAAAWEAHAGASTFTVAAGGFRGPQRDGDRTRVVAGQLVWRIGDPAEFSVETVGSWWSFEPDHLRASYIRQNYSEPAGGGVINFVSRFRIGDAIVRLRFPVASAPVTVSLDALKNFGSRAEAKGDDEAFEGSLTVGNVGTPGQVRAFYTFQYVKRDAVLGAYNTDDWWFHSWYRGHRFGAAITIFPQLFVQGTATYQQRLDRDFFWLRRFTIDMVKMF